MPRKALLIDNFYPYHVTARTNNRVPFPLPIEEMWQIITHELWTLQVVYEIEIHAFVLMPNHLHLILTVPEFDLGKIMNLFMSNVTRLTNKETGQSGHLFGGPYHWTSIRSSQYFSHGLKYVYRNPVRAGLCDQVEDYNFSTFSGLIGVTHLPFPISFTRAGFENATPGTEPMDWLEWLNQPFSSETEKLIQEGLRKKIFESRINPKTRRRYKALEKV